MARSRAPATSARWDQERLAGKTVALAGQFSRWDRERLEELLDSEGAELVDDVTEKLDYLLVGKVSGKTTLAQKKADKLALSGGAKIQVLTHGDFRRMLAPDRALAEAILRAGEKGTQRWQLLRQSGLPLDLNGCDLRGVDLRKFWLWQVSLEGADLRECNLEGTWGLDLARARLEGARLAGCGVQRLSEARLRKADLSKARLFDAVLERADFTEANLHEANLDRSQANESIFVRATLTQARLEKAKLQQADFTGADLTKADLREADLGKANLTRCKLQGADLSQAVLTGADLSKADLRDAILLDADLTGARIDGANFTGANLVGVKLPSDTSKAKGLVPAAPTIQPGPHLQELDRYASQAARVKLLAQVRLPDGEVVPVEVNSSSRGKMNTLLNPKQSRWNAPQYTSASAALIASVQPFLHGHLQLDSIKVTAEGPYGGKKLQRLALAAWCEAFGRPVPGEEDLQAQVEADRASTLEQRDALLAELRSGPAGVERFNARPSNERKHAGPYHNLDLSGAKLNGVDFTGLDFRGASFEKSSLVGANLQSGEFREARFVQCDLTRADLRGASLHSADFARAKLRESNLRLAKFRGTSLVGADLTGADASHANFCGADLTSATLSKLELDRTEFDEKTVWPAGFTPPRDMLWRGKAVDPRFSKPRAAPVTAAPAPTLTLSEFMSRLRGVVDPSRLANALQMLRAERFQLFTQVEDDRLVGVIRSQSSDERVYACKLTSDGGFSCGTQNLRVCGGLGGAICKHLLVLIVGLANTGKVDLGRTYQWVCHARAQRPLFDKEEAGAVFLRYKGAEAGEIDWRPTETIPEDYHTF